MFRITTRNILLSSLVLLGASNIAHAATKPIKIAAAIDCKMPSSENNYKGNCPYLYEVLKGDPQFKKLLLGTLEYYKVQHMDGPESPLETIKIDGIKYITGNKCEAHWCHAHRYTFIYSISERRISGIYQPDGKDPYFFGAPNEAEQKKLIELSQ